MGGYTFLRKKRGCMSMMDSFRLELDDASHVDKIQINGMNLCYEHTLSLQPLEDIRLMWRDACLCLNSLS